MDRKGNQIPNNQYQTKKEYHRIETQKLKNEMEAPNYLQLIGDIEGKSVIDLGCGDGYYTRIFNLKKGSSVVGVDLCSELIDIAIEMGPSNIKYYVADCQFFTLAGQYFDIVAAEFLIQHATSLEMLQNFIRTAYGLLNSNGRFVGITRNMKLTPENYHFQHNLGGRQS
ncbi:UNKNOWN [Stylonychia lemnae]|uniref:Methyltransferase type 11 domain-containing protein n=1 Tax=Stylonychia lemnae TaxID=5949 RepID=A0A078ALM5_STYLE|nr:UNKNOWN [Stylonychia lemnae]|eukprot:CDW83124.1 UNKNOWN [Stylonychia lemnae]